MDEIPYLMRGASLHSTDSSLLISSSKYLNHPVIRDWTVTESLRRNGRDLPFTYFIPALMQALSEIQDKRAIDAMFASARAEWAELDAWFTRRDPCRLTMNLIAGQPDGSIGRLLHDQLAGRGLGIEIVPAMDTTSDFDYFRMRAVQYHDLHHLLFGASLDQLGEVTPDLVKFGSYYKFFAPELACELTLQTTFMLMSLIPRTQLHYPQYWPSVWRDISRGMRIGETSDAWFLAPFEEILHLAPEDARNELGIRNVEDLDTTEASRHWGEGRLY